MLKVRTGATATARLNVSVPCLLSHRIPGKAKGEGIIEGLGQSSYHFDATLLRFVRMPSLASSRIAR
ncbi:Na_H_Exchanger domain-containing protein [Psidium guajava]|nr:Na_H_Exchanger domain-containing protein [Psidium guajava]